MASLSGTWLCSETEGMAEVLKAEGVGWMQRSALAAFGHGKDKSTQTISTNGSHFHFKTGNAWNSIEFDVIADGSEQDISRVDGTIVNGTVSLEGEKLIFRMGESTVCREATAGTMTMTISCNGKTAVRTYKKQ
ncbi:hypothetical protein CYMTET_17341 [Cymbomonas tetramitiformis]|uniref:Uncharacterized protein n=1 Tax=Cymbomonas tetramitiformis TaxID=36881 RepID=A0AAE0L7E7_9CHLO|nr:hypothetical protein CYMTET_17341 [Cymbomonas tetramitiformis]|eukprot:gene17063-20282_t